MIDSSESDKLKECLDQVLNWAETSSEFVKEQAPLVVQEILNYHFYYAISAICIWLLIFLLAFCVLQSISRFLKEPGEKLFFKVVSFIPLLIYIPVFGYNFLTLVQISFAPRLYILEYLSMLLKRN